MPTTGQPDRDIDQHWVSLDDDWIPPGIDPTKPSAARMYDYYLGGKDNYGADRDVASRVVDLCPQVPLAARANRRFVYDAVERLARLGVEQFVDLGCGIPQRPYLHEVARRAAPRATLCYVDHDAVAVTHARAALSGTRGVVVRHEDLRRPEQVLDPRALAGVVDLDRPVGLVMGTVLQYVDHQLSTRLLNRYRQIVAPGSGLVVSAACRDGADPTVLERVEDLYAATPSPVTFRTRTEFEGLFDGWQLLDPGVVPLGGWSLRPVADDPWGPPVADPGPAAPFRLGMCAVAVKDRPVTF